jgi:hypothetical protein
MISIISIVERIPKVPIVSQYPPDQLHLARLGGVLRE